jgi:hypothetical protein
VLVQSNTFVRNGNTVLDLVLGGRALTYRNNTANGGAILEDQGHTAALPAAWLGPYYSD